jgi:hypothetical protein
VLGKAVRARGEIFQEIRVRSFIPAWDLLGTWGYRWLMGSIDTMILRTTFALSALVQLAGMKRLRPW